MEKLCDVDRVAKLVVGDDPVKRRLGSPQPGAARAAEARMERADKMIGGAKAPGASCDEPDSVPRAGNYLTDGPEASLIRFDTGSVHLFEAHLAPSARRSDEVLGGKDMPEGQHCQFPEG